MCALLKPISGYVPTPAFGRRVAGPPSANLSAQQLASAREDPLSFRFSLGRRVGGSHAKATEWLEENQGRGVLQRFGSAVLVYRQSGENVSATGLIADVSLDAYGSGLIEPHENTIAKTERKMADYMRTTRIYGNPVALGHRPDAGMRAAIDTHTGAEPDTVFSTVDGLTHELWAIAADEAEELCRAFDDALYVTDGHHRLAAALRVAAEEYRKGSFIPAGLFAADELRLRSFARCIVQSGLDHQAIIGRLSSEHHMIEVAATAARPAGRNEFGVRLGDRHFRLRLLSEEIPDDPYESLDVNLLEELILGPVFGIDPGGDKRIQFVADSSETSQLDLDADAWFLPYPAEVEDVMAVADSGRVMPPKSTLFTPKLPSGLVIRTVDGD